MNDTRCPSCQVKTAAHKNCCQSCGYLLHLTICADSTDRTVKDLPSYFQLADLNMLAQSAAAPSQSARP